MSATLQKRSNNHGVGARRTVSRNRRHFRLRKKISGSAARPRLVVFRSLRQIYVQLVDDVSGHTLASASSQDASVTGTKSEQAVAVGKLVAERAKAAGVSKVVFDRGGNAYQGRIAKLADAAREAGLEF